jgi:hypothetical protein
MNEGKQKENIQAEREKLNIGSARGGETSNITDIGRNHKPTSTLTSLCDNIWLHMGWNAPCELPRKVVPVP